MRSIRHLLLTALLGIGCGGRASLPASPHDGAPNEDPSCEIYDGEFAQERYDFCVAGNNTSRITEKTTLGDLCDIIDGVQRAAASTFLDHDWIQAPDNKPLFKGNQHSDLSAVFVPSAVPDIYGMQCFRDDPKGVDTSVYGCSLSSGDNPLVPDIYFSAKLPYLSGPYTINIPYLAVDHTLPGDDFQTILTNLTFSSITFEAESTFLEGYLRAYGSPPKHTLDVDCRTLDKSEFYNGDNGRVDRLVDFVEERLSE